MCHLSHNHFDKLGWHLGFHQFTKTKLELSVISVSQPIWLQTVQNSYDDNPVAQKLLTALAVQNPMGHFQLT